jgi:hypothetical protein
VEVEAVLTLRGRFQQPPREARATVTVDSLAGELVQEVGHTRSGERGTRGAVRLARGLYRVVARGEVTLADGTRQPFIARGPFIRVE